MAQTTRLEKETAPDTSNGRPPSLSSTSTLGNDPGNDTQNSLGERPSCFKNTLTECLFVAIATLAVAQNTILSGSMRSLTSQIGNDLKMNDAEVTWIIAAQSMTAGTFLLFFGRVSDLFGRRWLLIGSMAMFSVFLLISGFATNALFFDSFMGLCGLACAAVVPPAIGKLGVVYDSPSKRKNRAFSCFGAGAPVGIVIGSWVSGIVTVITTWRAVLWVLAFIYACFTVMAWFTVPPDEEQEFASFNLETLKRFDLLGTLLVTVGIASFVAALTEAGVAPKGWATNYVIALLVIGVVFLAGFIVWERKCEHPMLPLSAWQDRNFTLLVIVLCLCFYAFNSNSFWLTLAWQNVYHNSALEVAIKFLPASIGGLLMCFTASMIIHKVGNRFISWVGVASMIIASALLSASSPDISYWALTFLALIFSVISQDLQFCVTNLYVVSYLPKEQRSMAGGLIQTTSRLAATVGLGVQTSVFKAVGGNTVGPRSTYYRAYQASFWLSLGGAVLAAFFLPFLTVGKQGIVPKESVDPEQGAQSRRESESNAEVQSQSQTEVKS